MASGPKRFDRFLKIYKHREGLLKLNSLTMKIPGMEKLMRRNEEKMHDLCELTYIPVSENIENPGSMVLPYNIIEHFIEKACHHVIMDRCPCRVVADCSDYPHDFACLFLGAGAREINPAFARHVTKEEAREHLKRGVELKLTPTMGRFILDAKMVGVEDHRHFMTICFCCPCCCLGNYTADMPEWSGNMARRMEGAHMEVTDACIGCGKCIETCMFNQISIVDGKKVIGDRCKACARCSVTCPRGGTKVVLDDPDYIEKVIKRISDFVDVT